MLQAVQFRGCWRAVPYNSLDPLAAMQIAGIESGSERASDSNSSETFDAATANEKPYIFAWPPLCDNNNDD